MQYFERRRVGDIQRRLNGLRQARQFVVQSGVRVVASLAQLLLAMVLMVLYSTTLAAVFLAALPCYVVALRVSLHRLRPLVDTLEDEFGRYSSRQVDAIKGIETVKAMATEDYVKRHLGETFDGLARRQFRVDFFGMAFDGAIRIAGFVSLALFLWIGALQVTSGALSVGSYVSFNALAAIAGAAIVALLTVWDDLQYATILLDRVEDVFTEEPERGTDRVAGAPSIDLHGNVSVERLTFAYGDDAKVLDDVSIEVAAGTRIAIVGRSGSGKTTLLRCLAGLIEPTAGAVLYDGIDLRELDVRTVRAGMGVVLQDSYLFDDTISANIAFGIDRPDPEQVMWAARMAGAHEFISRLPFRYQTRVGESGLALSGGERQRICIARALYRRPPVVLLDEATSALDSESERAVKQGLDELLRGKTVFVVAHRMSTVRDADLIVVLDRGRIVERGTHLELMERRGLYYRLSGDRLDV
jgi:ATP-binding cassette subfamily B protein